MSPKGMVHFSCEYLIRQPSSAVKAEYISNNNINVSDSDVSSLFSPDWLDECPNFNLASLSISVWQQIPFLTGGSGRD